MKVDYRRSTAAYKTSHRCLFSLRVGSRVHHSRLFAIKSRLWETFLKPLHNDVPFTHVVNKLHSVQYTCMYQMLEG